MRKVVFNTPTRLSLIDITSMGGLKLKFMEKVNIFVNKQDFKKSGVYIISNNINDMCYIGSTVNFSTRLAGHIHDCKRGKGNPYLKEFLTAYKLSDLNFRVLEFIADKDQLKVREDFFIKSKDFKNLWNVAENANSILGISMPESHKNKCKERMIGNTIKRGSSVAKETAEKISLFWKSNPERLEQMREKNRESQKNIDRSSWKKGIIFNVFLENVFLKRVYGLNTFEKMYNISHSSASVLSRNPEKTIKGHRLEKIGSFHETDKCRKEKLLNGEIIIKNL